MRPQDYSKYSIAELREALSTVDGIKYPENKAALEAEYQKRVDSGEVEREQQKQELEEHEKEQGYRRFARNARPWIGLYLVGAPLILPGSGLLTPPDLGWIGYVIWVAIVLYVCVAVVAGYGLWKGKDWGRRTAIGVFAMQVIDFRSGFLAYSLTSALSAFVHFTPADFGIAVSASVSLGAFLFSVGDLPYPVMISFNLFAIFMIWLLLKARQPLDGDGAGIDSRPEALEERPDLRP